MTTMSPKLITQRSVVQIHPPQPSSQSLRGTGHAVPPFNCPCSVREEKRWASLQELCLEMPPTTS